MFEKFLLSLLEFVFLDLICEYYDKRNNTIKSDKYFDTYERLKDKIESDKYWYFLNWMGPLNKKWIDEETEKGNKWAGGRVDVSYNKYMSPGGSYCEYGLMISNHNQEWIKFGDWLNRISPTNKLFSKEELYQMFEEDTGINLIERTYD